MDEDISNTSGNIGECRNDNVEDEDNMDTEQNSEVESNEMPEEESKLIVAATLNKLRMLRHALFGPNKDQEIVHMDKALLCAVSFGHIECTRLLLQYSSKEDPDLLLRESKSLLMSCVQRRNLEMSKLLIEHGCIVNSTDKQGNNALHWAVKLEDTEMVQYFTKFMTLLDTHNSKRETPLIMAAEAGSEEIIRLLVQNGSDVMKTKFSKRTAFYRSIEKGHVRCVAAFLELGVDPLHKDSDGRCSLHMAAAKTDIKLMQMLMDAGCSVNVMDDDKQTPLFELAWLGDLDCLEFVVSSGAQVNICNIHGNTPLLTAAIRGHLPTIKFLVNAGADVNHAGYKYQTALHHIAHSVHVDCLQYLVHAKGVQLDKVAYDGLTLAHFVVLNHLEENNKIKMLEILLDMAFDFEQSALFHYSGKRRLVTPFELSLSLGKLYIACWFALVDVNMKLLQAWLQMMKRQEPVTDSGDHMIKWLIDKASKLMALKQTCRKVIRKTVCNKPIEKVISKLPLPGCLQAYVAFHNENLRDQIPVLD